ncbi:MAG: MFS transporter [Oscillospiraceae bacterium]|nr:MFS transporter [Oscillospiraceae bacterium]
MDEAQKPAGNKAQSLSGPDQKQIDYVYENRRYVGRRETVGYVIWDMAQSYNINNYGGRFITSILQVDMTYQQIINFFSTIWDIINDIFTAAIIEKTRTRWGKFKPYLVVLMGPGTLGNCIFWLLPFFFIGSDPKSLSKAAAFFALGFLRDFEGTFRGISRGGLLATITPHPVDRTRLITQANFWSGFLGEKLPEQLMTVFIDLIDNRVWKAKDGNISGLFTRLFSGMGIATAIVSGTASFWFCFITRERVMQSIQAPTIRQSIKSITNNRPILLLTLSKIINSLSIGGAKEDYFIDVLHFASMTMVAGIPGAFMHPIGYALIPWFRKRWSTMFLYIGNYLVSTMSILPVFLVGAIGGAKNGLYKRKIPMLIAYALQEMLFMLLYGLGEVIENDIQNEAMDYCEWRNGYRTEAMTSVARGLAIKLGGILTGTINLQIKKWARYDQTTYVRGLEQSDKTKFYLFAACTVMPLIAQAASITPMFFYNLKEKERENMYAELLDRRQKAANTVTGGDLEAIERLAKEQMEIGDRRG